MSSLRGTVARLARGRDLAHKPIKDILSVVGSGARLGVVLDGRTRNVEQAQPLDRAVIEVDVGQLRFAEIGVPAHGLVVVDGPRSAWPEHRETVVLAGDLHPAGGQVLDRMVGA